MPKKITKNNTGVFFPLLNSRECIYLKQFNSKSDIHHLVSLIWELAFMFYFSVFE